VLKGGPEFFSARFHKVIHTVYFAATSYSSVSIKHTESHRTFKNMSKSYFR